jgi:hypothetical protein
MEPCCVARREQRAAWAEYMALMRVVVFARTGVRIRGREPELAATS